MVTEFSRPYLPLVFAADDAVPHGNQITKPYAQKGLTDDKSIFNYRLSRARRTNENLFGILFNIFHTKIHLSVDTTCLLTMACCILHNLLCEVSSTSYTPANYVDQVSSNGEHETNVRKAASEVEEI